MKDVRLIGIPEEIRTNLYCIAHHKYMTTVGQVRGCDIYFEKMEHDLK